jgi:hypothetical protein
MPPASGYHLNGRAGCPKAGQRGYGKRVVMQNGLYFFMMLGVALLASLGTAVAVAVVLDVREKLGR